MPSYSKKPLLTDSDEEYSMLIEVTEEFEKQKTEKTAREKFGNATEIVVRNHLIRRNLNLSILPNVTIQGSKIKNESSSFKDQCRPKPTNVPI